ncbi:MAG: Gfo/Idh/MocA family oxidoreductase [Parcubacteria group bacterium]|nr:Gfo/Idh/MocA family oxidoreductase [Parcubacteria group bacterium]
MTLSFALVGAGHFGKHYIRLLREVKGARLGALFDRSLAAETAVFPGIRRVTKYEEILSDPNIHAVIIATPAPTHAELALAALKAGKHVLVEKPMTTNLSDALRLERAVRESGKTLMIGHQYLYNDYIRAAKGILDSGALGTLRSFTAVNVYPGPIRKGMGCFWETATHELAILDYLFGPQEIEDVSGRAVFMTKEQEFEDAATVVARLSSGVSVSISVSWFAPKKMRHFFICGDKGMLLFDDIEESNKLRKYRYEYPKEEVFSGKNSFFFDQSSENVMVPEVSAKEPLKNQLEHFIRVIETNTEPLTNIAHGVRVTRLLDTIDRVL